MAVLADWRLPFGVPFPQLADQFLANWRFFKSKLVNFCSKVEFWHQIDYFWASLLSKRQKLIQPINEISISSWLEIPDFNQFQICFQLKPKMVSFIAEKPRKSGLLNTLWSQIDILVLFISLTNGGFHKWWCFPWSQNPPFSGTYCTWRGFWCEIRTYVISSKINHI